MFIHLRARSSYSLLSGALRIEQMAQLCQLHKMPALALTDYGNLFGALEFSQTLSEKGIQPIIGCCLPLVGHISGDKPVNGVGTLLAQNIQGYQHLMYLSEYFSAHDQCVPLEELYTHNTGLIFLTGGFDGPLHQLILEQRNDDAQELLTQWQHIFDNRLYIELQRHDMDAEKRAEPFLLHQALSLNLPVVATHEPYFLDADYYEAHDALLAIAQGVRIEEGNRKRVSAKHYFTSPQEMENLFRDIPEAIENTRIIARRISFRPMPSAPLLPFFVCKEKDSQLLEEKTRAGLAKKMGPNIPLPYQERLEYELQIITRMEFSGYFLIVSDFILWAKDHDIPVGPGRGSGAGSLVSWCLSITDLDPLRFGLLFERFLNPERISLPDFDIDFCQERRDEVIAYVRTRYGTERVAHIITFGKLQARAVLRDVGRVLGMPYGQVDRICKLVPFNPTHPPTLQESIDSEPRLQQERDNDPTVAKLITMSLKLEGLYRHASVHAAGIVIGHKPLRDTIPLYRDVRSNLVTTQFSMKWVEKSGLVKFDFLGLKTLSVIAETCHLLKKNGLSITIDAIPLNDTCTFKLLSSGQTRGIFQLEASSMRDVLKKMKPDRLEDIIALVALNRPGPMDNIPRYIHCKNGLETPHYMHEKLRPILEETYGIIVYQEQVIQIAQALAGYAPGDADLLRRAMGKKIQEEMDAQRERFVQGAQKNGVPIAQATRIFELVNKFAGYGYNKSHATAYGMISYQTAYLKANYPLTFMAALMSLDMGNVDKLALHRDEMIRLGLTLHPPNVNVSEVAFTPTHDALYYGLGAIKNVGAQAMEKLVHIRKTGGPFTDIFDLLARCGHLLNKKNLESLIYAGALDCLNANRAQLAENIDILIKYASASQNKDQSFQMRLFDAPVSVPSLRDVLPFTPIQALHHEFEAIGFYLSNHPLHVYAQALDQYNIATYAQFLETRPHQVFLAGVVTHLRIRKSRQGGAYAFITLSDTSGQFEFIAFGQAFDAIRDILAEGVLLAVQIEADWNAFAKNEAAADSGDMDEDSLTKPRLRALHIQNLRTMIEGEKTSASHHTKQTLIRLRITLAQIIDITILKRHLKGNGPHTIYLAFPPIMIDGSHHHIELLLGHNFDAHSLIQAFQEGSLDAISKIETL